MLLTDNIDTPCLLLDLTKVHANMARLHGLMATAGIAVRAHAKAHKCPELAQVQIAAGAVGICCQKVSEAAVFLSAGINDIVVTNQIIGRQKAQRFVQLVCEAQAKQASVAICVDHALQIEQLTSALQAFPNAIARVWIEIDVGQGRCGVTSIEDALALLRLIAAKPQLSFVGLQAYHGSMQHVRTAAEREAISERIQAMVKQYVASCAEQLNVLGLPGLPSQIAVAGGGTGSYELDAVSGIYTEVQPGSYVLMDADYSKNERGTHDGQFANALTVLCSVISERPGQIVIDGGLKCFAVDSGLPEALTAGLRVKSVSDEHATIEVLDLNLQPLIGKKLEFIPGHCDPTVNLHDEFVVHQAGSVFARWPISARGALF